MPAAGLRRRIDRVDHVIVERRAEDGVQETESVDSDATVVVDQLLRRIDEEQQSQVPPSLSTATYLNKRTSASSYTSDTLSSATRTTIVPALSQHEEDDTVVVTFTSSPQQPPPGGHPEGHKGGISQSTEHLLIAAGSIGATIIIVMVILGIHTMRKRGLTLGQALKAGRYQVTHGGPPPPPKQPTPTTFWPDVKKQDMSDYGSLRSQSVTPPQAAVARSGSIKSQKPLAPLDRSDSFNLDRTASFRDEPTSFYLQSPPARNNSHRRNGSGNQLSNAPQSSTNNTRKSFSTRNTRTMYDEESELQYADPPQERAMSPLPPPPTFKQFLSNRPSGSVKQGFDNMMSRFSWTNSNAPQTPHDASRDTKTAPVQRESYMTSRSSVPRFRTIDSWVNQQTNRLEVQKLKDQFRLTSTTVGSQDSEARDIVPEVPAIPKNVQALRESSARLNSQLPNRRPATPPGLPGRNIKHQRHDTRTTVDTAPIFRQHPGNEVRFSTKSDVPSEILDRGRRDDVLS
ncbi:hypothetical protein DM02DRAFT_97146 [Periconia macrospinosa]|uniref:Uncharacterized protein n=1 Tax=Periconia macrospinosa TaxID=97972 RepID=A0A2V1E6M9_9PLEO|nr:hypothetical protein DM02DRAFT_97146 [Periconia macrospinosa]